MSEAKHTPEPWDLSCLGAGEEIEALRITGPGDEEVIPPTYMDTPTEENFKRIVSCVNACEGLNPEAVPELVAKLEHILEYWNGADGSAVDALDHILTEVAGCLAKANEGKP